MNGSHRGLKELYDKFGGTEFTGSPLRDVMVQVIGGPSSPKAGWQASIALSRLIKAGVVEETFHDDGAKASWGHNYAVSSKGLNALGVDAVDEYDLVRAFIGRIGDRRVRISPAFINDPANRAMLRLGVATRWLDMAVSVTSAGVEWAATVEGDKLRD